MEQPSFRFPEGFEIPVGGRRRLPSSLRSLLTDRYLWALLILALVVNLGLFALLIVQFGNLPPLVPLHFDPGGEPDRIEARNAIFSLPQIGLLIILLNMILAGFFYGRERLAAYLLAGMSILIQFFLWFAAIGIIRAISVQAG